MHLLTSLSTSCCLYSKKEISLLMGEIQNTRTLRDDAACCVPKASSSSARVYQVVRKVPVMDLHLCLAVTSKLGSILNLFSRYTPQFIWEKKNVSNGRNRSVKSTIDDESGQKSIKCDLKMTLNDQILFRICQKFPLFQIEQIKMIRITQNR